MYFHVDSSAASPFHNLTTAHGLQSTSGEFGTAGCSVKCNMCFFSK